MMKFASPGKPKSDDVFNVVNYSVLCLFMLSVLYPLIFVVSSSFSSTEATTAGKVWLWPVEPSLKGYEVVFQEQSVWIGFYNSFFYAIAGTCLTVIVTVLAAYPLSRKHFRGKHVFTQLFIFASLFNGGMIPAYLLIRDLGWLDTRLALIVPGALTIWNVILMRTYFKNNIPEELWESAQLDGCGDWRFLLRIAVPLSGPIIAVIVLYSAVSMWNQFFNAMLYLKSSDLQPLQVVLRNILVRNEVSNIMLSNVQEMTEKSGLRELLKYSLIVVASLPVLVLYPFVQKYFVKGIMVGSLKG